MRPNPARLLVLLLIPFLMQGSQVTANQCVNGYFLTQYGRRYPCLTSSWTNTPPKIDGTIDSEDWGAATISNAVFVEAETENQVAAKIYVMNDNEHVYFAIELPRTSGLSLTSIYYCHATYDQTDNYCSGDAGAQPDPQVLLQFKISSDQLIGEASFRLLCDPSISGCDGFVRAETNYGVGLLWGWPMPCLVQAAGECSGNGAPSGLPSGFVEIFPASLPSATTTATTVTSVLTYYATTTQILEVVPGYVYGIIFVAVIISVILSSAGTYLSMKSRLKVGTTSTEVTSIPCVKCGTKIPLGSKWCDNCGASQT